MTRFWIKITCLLQGPAARAVYKMVLYPGVDIGSLDDVLYLDMLVQGGEG